MSSDIYVKLEYLNPGGSIKDRMGVYLCQKAVERGDLKPGGTIVESTSGNTGVGIALFAAIHGYNCVFVMADKQSQEKIDATESATDKLVNEYKVVSKQVEGLKLYNAQKRIQIQETDHKTLSFEMDNW